MRKNFVQFSWVTILAVYLLILVGGIVRSTGSGMGCPDWPKCFGKIVPPTDIRELPENYKEIYAQKRKEKNLRLVGFLKSIGMKDAAQRVQNDETIYIEEDFNVQKTWIEYLNRLLGVLIGLLIFVTFITSLSYLKTKPIVSILSFVALLLVGFQGWIGSIVVSTNLLEGMITLHMFFGSGASTSNGLYRAFGSKLFTGGGQSQRLFCEQFYKISTYSEFGVFFGASAFGYAGT